MKAILTLLVLAFSINVSAAEKGPEKTPFMSKGEQMEYLYEVSKDIRRSYWVQGYDDVESSVYFMDKKSLDKHFSKEESEYYESHLDRDEISQLYKCHYSKKCETYLVHVSSSYYGGTGYEAHFVNLYTKTKKHFTFRHTIYAE